MQLAAEFQDIQGEISRMKQYKEELLKRLNEDDDNESDEGLDLQDQAEDESSAMKKLDRLEKEKVFISLPVHTALKKADIRTISFMG